MRRNRRDLRLEAWLLWMIPRAAALSSRLTARRRSSAAVSAPTSAADTAFLMRVLTSDLAALLRTRAISLVRLRLIWLLMLATAGVLPVPFGRTGCLGNPVMLSAGRRGHYPGGD